MSSSLEYLPLFTFVLTLTYKKERQRERKQKTKKHTQQQKGCLDAGESMASQPSVTGVRRGHRVHFGMHSSSSMMPCELFPSVCLYTAYWDQEFAAQSSVLLWTHQRVPIGPFEILCYHAIKGKLSGPEGYMEELINLM